MRIGLQHLLMHRWNPRHLQEVLHAPRLAFHVSVDMLRMDEGYDPQFLLRTVLTKLGYSSRMCRLATPVRKVVSALQVKQKPDKIEAMSACLCSYSTSFS